MFLMREKDSKLWNKIKGLCGREKWFTKTRKRVSRRLNGRCFHMTVRTDLWKWALPREELLPMAIQASCMFWKLGHIRKCGVAFAHFLPILGRKLMTRTTREFLFSNMSGVREA